MRVGEPPADPGGGADDALEDRRTFVVTGAHGLHARPAATFVRTAAAFSSRVRVIKRGREANAKSLVSVLSLGVSRGDEIEIVAEGTDAAEAVAALGALGPEESGDSA